MIVYKRAGWWHYDFVYEGKRYRGTTKIESLDSYRHAAIRYGTEKYRELMRDRGDVLLEDASPGSGLDRCSVE